MIILSSYSEGIDFPSIIEKISIKDDTWMLGERLFDLRKDAGLTQDELAAILNINKHSISSYERDKSEPPDAIKIEIARFFHVSVDYLIGLSDDPAIASAPNVFRLPSGFPQTALPELRDYVNYLCYKYRRTK